MNVCECMQRAVEEVEEDAAEEADAVEEVGAAGAAREDSRVEARS